MLLPLNEIQGPRLCELLPDFWRGGYSTALSLFMPRDDTIVGVENVVVCSTGAVNLNHPSSR